jgi:hypothetical protein
LIFCAMRPGDLELLVHDGPDASSAVNASKEVTGSPPNHSDRRNYATVSY